LNYLSLLREFGTSQSITQLVGFKIQNTMNKAAAHAKSKGNPAEEAKTSHFDLK